MHRHHTLKRGDSLNAAGASLCSLFEAACNWFSNRLELAIKCPCLLFLIEWPSLGFHFWADFNLTAALRSPTQFKQLCYPYIIFEMKATAWHWPPFSRTAWSNTKRGGEISWFHWRLISLMSLTLHATQLKHKPDLPLDESRENTQTTWFKAFPRPAAAIQSGRFHLYQIYHVQMSQSNSLPFINWELLYSTEVRAQQLMRG